MAKLRFTVLCLSLLPVICGAEQPPPPNETTSPRQTESQAQEKDTRYVDDNLLIMLRAGNSNKHKIIRHIPSGTKLEVLETVDDYSRVRTKNGTEGWVLHQYLSKEPIARHKLRNANQLIAKLETQNKQLKKELNQVTHRHGELTTKTNKLEDQLQQFRSVAAKPMKLHEEKTALIKEKVALENKMAILEQEVQILRDQSEKKWFLIGAGVLLGGIVLGILAPRMRRRRKSDWSSL